MSTRSGRPLLARQLLTLSLLFGGYAALYFCRADLSVGTPLLAGELAHGGLSHSEALVRLGAVSSFGVGAYAVGKLFLGGLGDFWGGRLNFLIGLAGATVFTLLFAWGGGVPLFTLAWIGNRLTQSLSWAGLIKVSSRWFDHARHGTVIGILSVSYLIGDAVARGAMGALIGYGFGWRALFYFAAAVCGILWLANGLWLRESRVEVGFCEARVNPHNLFGEGGGRPSTVGALLGPLLRSRAFLLVCILSFGATIVRETFNTWTPQYLRDFAGLPVSLAAAWSALFPGVGAVSVLLSGWLSDRLGESGRAALLFVGLLGTCAGLILLTSLHAGVTGALLPLTGIGVAAFCLLGPYSYLGGAMALDFGGRQAGAVSSGIIDGVGYLGGVLAGFSVPLVAESHGWQGVFIALAAVSAVAALGAGWLLLHNRAQPAARPA